MTLYIPYVVLYMPSGSALEIYSNVVTFFKMKHFVHAHMGF